MPRIWTLLCLAVFVGGLTSTAQCEDPVKVDVCQLHQDPKAYHHKLVEVSGFISHDFEDFTFFGPGCPGFGVWLEYGGKVNSGTIYCCGVTANRRRPSSLYVENIAVPLTDDKRFREFDALIQREPSSLVHATLIGRFFANPGDPKNPIFSGYGHFGCCSLLAIQRVLAVDSQTRYGLDYRRYAYRPQNACDYKDFMGFDLKDELIRAQRAAELEGKEWAFHDPQRVAVEAVARISNTDRESIKKMRWVDGDEGRVVYQWTDKRKKLHYFVELSHPYLLAFDAADPKKIAWVPIAVYQSTCKMNFPDFHTSDSVGPELVSSSIAVAAVPMH